MQYQLQILHLSCQRANVRNVSFRLSLRGVLNGLIQFKSARKIWPLLELLAKIRWVLAYSCSQNFCCCSHSLMVKRTKKPYGKMHALWMFLEGYHSSSFCWRFIETRTSNNSSRKAPAPAKVERNLELWWHIEYYQYYSELVRYVFGACRRCTASISLILEASTE